MLFQDLIASDVADTESAGSNIATTLDIGSDWKNECAEWNAYYAKSVYKQTDSGL